MFLRKYKSNRTISFVFPIILFSSIINVIIFALRFDTLAIVRRNVTARKTTTILKSQHTEYYLRFYHEKTTVIKITK